MASNEEDYELFRRAIVGRDEDAWAAIYARYRSLLIAWAARCSTHSLHTEAGSDIADHALARAWSALTPERFATFSSLKQLLAYLRVCVTSAAIDSVRAQVQFDSLIQRQPARVVASPEQIVLADLERTDLWDTVLRLSATPAERVALVEGCVYSLPPRAILARHPQLFPDVRAVYAAKRNLIDRLRRHHEILRLREEHVQ